MSKTVISIDNLPTSLDEDLLRTYFIPFGEIVSVALEEGKSEDVRIGRIEYEESGDAESAIDNMQDAELLGRVITVTWADTRVAFEGLGSKVPLWEQEGFIQRYLVDQQNDAMQGLEEQGHQQQALPVSVGPMPSK